MELKQADRDRLKHFLDGIKTKTENFLGYPVSKDFDYKELFEFLKYPLNNLGDPFTPSTWKVDSREFEREVIDFMASLFRARDDDYWGYVTNGGSEGNLYGLYLARELYPKGVVYYSQDTHYSVSKNLHLLNMRHIMIRSQPNGEMEYADLQETLRIHRDKPAIIFANIGTTMTEAKDDLLKIKTILKKLVISEHYIIRFYIPVDKTFFVCIEQCFCYLSHNFQYCLGVIFENTLSYPVLKAFPEVLHGDIILIPVLPDIVDRNYI